TMDELTNNTPSINSKNKITVIYFANSIFQRLYGFTSKIFTVPQLNSFATIPAAIIITISPTVPIIDPESLINVQTLLDVSGGRSCSIRYSLIAISFIKNSFIVGVI